MTARNNVHYMGHHSQRTEESIAYPADFANLGTPTSPVCTIYDHDDFTDDLTSIHLTGSAGVSGDVITSPLVGALVDGQTYRLFFYASVNGNTPYRYIDITCDDDEE